MAHSIVLDESRVVPVPVEDAFSRTLPAPLPELFRRWHGPIPPVREVRDQSGAWDAAGQTRTVCLAGGATMREELTAVDAPRSFRYRLSNIRGPMAVLIDHVVGEWIFDSAAGGTRVTWRWEVYARSALTSWALPSFGRVWKGYARRALSDLADRLTG